MGASIISPLKVAMPIWCVSLIVSVPKKSTCSVKFASRLTVSLLRCLFQSRNRDTFLFNTGKIGHETGGNVVNFIISIEILFFSTRQTLSYPHRAVLVSISQSRYFSFQHSSTFYGQDRSTHVSISQSRYFSFQLNPSHDNNSV